MEQQAILDFWALQSIPSRISEQEKAFCTPTYKIFNDIVSMDQENQERYSMTLSMQITLGFVIWGGQYGYIMVSKFGLHQIATHSPICKIPRVSANEQYQI